MLRAASTLASCLVVVAIVGHADADRHSERPVCFEVGINTRHFAPADDDQIAFRSTEPPDASLGEGTAISTSIRFTARTAYNTFVGVEGEAGALVGHEGSNLAGAYGVAGARGDLGPVQLGVELVTGRRWVRYELAGLRTDPQTWITEPRVRADLWLGPNVTLGGAIGATLSERSVWMAGIYLGVNSAPFNTWR